MNLNKNGAAGRGKALWRSLDDLADTPRFREFVEKEFPNHSEELFHSTSRRHFLKVMGASLALAGGGGLSGCLRWPGQEVLPFTSRPEGRIPGVPVEYATCFEMAESVEGVIATSFDGRPIRVDGNPEHPGTQGTASAVMQASVLGLYDPARSTEVTHASKGGHSSSDWNDAHKQIREVFKTQVAADGGKGIAILSEPSSSPTLHRMRRHFQRVAPAATWYEYAPISRDSERTGSALAFGRPMRPHYDFARARVVLCLDADPLMSHPAALSLNRGYAASRNSADSDPSSTEGPSISRLYSIESTLSVTGSVADVRMPARNVDIPLIAARVARALVGDGAPADVAAALERAGDLDPQLKSLVSDLDAHRGSSLVIAGDRQPPEVHAVAHLINMHLGNYGLTVKYSAVPNPDRTRSHSDEIAELSTRMAAGEVDMVVILGGNPVLDAPADSAFGASLAKVPTSVRLGLYEDETSKLCQWHLPQAHYLEAWSDGRAWDGTISIGQPLIEPLYDGRTPAEVVSLVVDDEPSNAHGLVRATHESLAGKIGSFASGEEFEGAWRRWLHAGFIPEAGSTLEIDSQVRVGGGWGAGLDALLSAPAGTELVFVADHSLDDGRFANNGWLQELPDPITKIAWDNAAVIAPSKAAELGVEMGDLVRLETDAGSLEMAAFLLPGQAKESITVAVGYGRKIFDRVAGGVSYNLAEGAGFDVYPLRSVEAHRSGHAAVKISKASGSYELATTQDHHVIDTLQWEEEQRRIGQFIRVVDVGEHPDSHHIEQEVAAAGPHHPPLKSLFDDVKYSGHRWAMAIDLNVCTGCSACVLACQAENNIAVVGKDEVAYGREMHWIRIDRYFRGDDVDNPEVVHQPMTCNQCENAPCEQVCPVAATTHNAEGLNDMVYNRCIGTRYCSNNCPYKVRRFNYFNNTKHPTEQEQMVYNPEVTIRSRGVMEKCTFCVQRINKAKVQAHNERRNVSDGEITPACAQTCPTQAITFGDLADPDSRVSQKQSSARAYKMLEELNIKPRTSFLAKLRNPAAGEEGQG